MGALADGIREALSEWLRFSWDDLTFAQTASASLIVATLLAITGVLLGARPLWRRRPERRFVTLPALLPVMGRSRISWLRHTPFLFFLAGIPFFAFALADPYTSLKREEVSYKGRRIALLVDASTSMIMRFETKTLNARSGPSFFTAVASAEHFVRRRMAGPYHDLISLIQFGDQAYVVTPFTTDYRNILLSLRLIGTPAEWGHFPEWGTTIIQGIEQGTALFKAFDFLNASGNLMVILSDGRDEQIRLKQQNLNALMLDARKNKIPIYMIRVAANMKLGEVRQDLVWKPAVELSGGRFYVAADEAEILRALDDIDRLSAGTIEMHQYTALRPRFAGYAMIAVFLWLWAGTLKLGLPYFRTFP